METKTLVLNRKDAEFLLAGTTPDESRPWTTRIWATDLGGGKTGLVGCDGHRLHALRCDVTPGLCVDAGLVPALLKVNKKASTIDIALGDGANIATQRFAQVIPAESDVTAWCQADVDLIRVLGSVRDQKDDKCKVSATAQVQAVVSHNGSTEAHFSVSIGNKTLIHPDLVGIDHELTHVGFDARYLSDATRGEDLGCKVRIGVRDALDPALILSLSSKDRFAVIMPLRI